MLKRSATTAPQSVPPAKSSHALWYSVRSLLLGFAIGLVAVALLTVPPAGWTSHDVTTGRHAGYPDLVPHRYDIPVSNATRVAAQVTTLLPGWKVVYLGAERGEMQAEVHRFPSISPDDVTIKIRPLASNVNDSEVLIRSHSRWGWADFGTNASHIRDLQAAMDDKLPRVP